MKYIYVEVYIFFATCIVFSILKRLINPFWFYRKMKLKDQWKKLTVAKKAIVILLILILLGLSTRSLILTILAWIIIIYFIIRFALDLELFS